MDHRHSPEASAPKGFWNSRYSIGLIVLGAVAAYFLLAEHRAHVRGAFPFLLILACPLMHVFMHRSHGGHDGGSGHGGQHPRHSSSAPSDPPGSPIKESSHES